MATLPRSKCKLARHDAKRMITQTLRGEGLPWGVSKHTPQGSA
ncbi:MAG: hypothetical protein ACPL5I_04410 [Thermodesulfobacteriota bacterium]